MSSNERLRGAIFEAGMTPSTLAEQVGVDPKTVDRWISTGRSPHRTHRLTTARILGRDDVYLWPDTAQDRQSLTAAQSELVTLYPNRGAVPHDMWFSLARNARKSIDILAFAASFLHDGLPGFTDVLAERARAGVRVRLLFGDPDSPAVALRGEEEGIDGSLGHRCSLSWKYLKPYLDTPGIEARMHGCTLYNSIFRFDEDILVNCHSYGAPASQSAILHVRRITGGSLFSHYMRGLDHTWDAATPHP